jgi:hypothetical protein
MIGREQAEAIASQSMGEVPDRTWELVEFDAGWLVRVTFTDGVKRRGGSTRVVERKAGRVVRFPSSVPPQLILSDYPRALERRPRVETPADCS